MKNKITKNYIYNLIYQALSVVTSMITMPYITRIILPAQMGVYSTSMALFSTVALAANFGVNVYGVRTVAIVQEDKDLLLNRFRHIFSTQVITAIIFWIGSALYSLLFLDATVNLIYVMNAFFVLNASVDIFWFYNGLEEFKITALRNIVVRTVAVLLVFLLVKDAGDILIYALIFVAAPFLGNLTMFFNLQKFLGTRRIFSFKWVDGRVIKEAFPFFVSLLLSQIYAEFGRYFVYGISGEAVTGIYDQALKVVRMLIILTVALVSVVGPRMSKLVGVNSHQEIRRYFVKIFVFLVAQSFLMAVGLLVVGNDFVSFFFGPAYRDVAFVLKVFAIYPVVFMLEQSVLVLLLRPLGRTRVMLVAVLSALGVNAALNLLLIPKMGAAGAAVSMILASLINSAIQIYSCRDFILFAPLIKNTLWIAVAAGITVGLLFLLKSVADLGAFINFCVFGAACILLYAGLVLLFCREIRVYFLENVRRKTSFFKSRKV